MGRANMIAMQMTEQNIYMRQSDFPQLLNNNAGL